MHSFFCSMDCCHLPAPLLPHLSPLFRYAITKFLSFFYYGPMNATVSKYFLKFSIGLNISENKRQIYSDILWKSQRWQWAVE